MARPAQDIAHLLLVDPATKDEVSRSRSHSSTVVTSTRKRKRGGADGSGGSVARLRSRDAGTAPLPQLRRELDLLTVIRHREKNAHGAGLWYRRLSQQATYLRRCTDTAGLLLSLGCISGVCMPPPLKSPDDAGDLVEKIDRSVHGKVQEVLLARQASSTSTIVHGNGDEIAWPNVQLTRYAPSVSGSTAKKRLKELLARLTEYRQAFLDRCEHWAVAYSTLLAGGRYVQLALILLGNLARCRALVSGLHRGSLIVDRCTRAEQPSEHAQGAVTVSTAIDDQDRFDLGQVIPRTLQPDLETKTFDVIAPIRTATRPDEGISSSVIVPVASNERPTGSSTPVKKKIKKSSTEKRKRKSVAKDEIDDIFG